MANHSNVNFIITIVFYTPDLLNCLNSGVIVDTGFNRRGWIERALPWKKQFTLGYKVDWSGESKSR